MHKRKYMQGTMFTLVKGKKKFSYMNVTGAQVVSFVLEVYSAS